MLHHIGIYVTNIEKSVPFYETILPIKEKEELKWEGGELLFLKGEGFQLELITSPDTVKGTHVAFSTHSVTSKIKELTKLGLSPSQGPYELQNGWKTVFYEGPDGEEIEFIETL
ncbi:VOC family protein [Fictibacillus nanhaiensis]|uniref:VOC family protein n=1 Tax=Fictibacillus nanhaiensis TaxID=742169 RepID=UPI001C967899|nr:VOC family protein [Fictibacillus nanhaiensis]MBY6038295.1 VOC family protein [Fictibacillus nanhaiensis]